MKIREQKQKHNLLLTELRELDKKDSLNETEQQRFDELYNETRSLKTEIEKREKIKDLELATVDAPAVLRNQKPEFSLYKSIKNLVTGKSIGFEGEKDQELRGMGYGTEKDSILIPTEQVFGRVEKRFLNAETALISDPVKPTEYLSGLYERSLLPKLGARMINASGDFSFPSSSGVQAAWWNADGTGSISESDPTYTSTEVTGSYLGVYSGWSLKQLTQLSKGDLSLESILREDMIGAMSAEMDKAAFTADGTSNAPKGIINLLGSGKETSKSLHGTNEWSLDDIVDEVKRLQIAAKMQMKTLSWCVSPEVSSELQKKQKFASSNGQALMENGLINGIPAAVSNWLNAKSPATTAGEVEVILGDWNQFLVVQYGAIELTLGQVNDDAIKKITRLIAHSIWSFAMRRADFFRLIRCDRTV